MIEVPADKPETMPDDEPMLATEVLLLHHEPPVEVSDKTEGLPTQITVVPEMGPTTAYNDEKTNSKTIVRFICFIKQVLV